MRQDYHPVFGQTQVGLDGVGSDIDSTAEGRYGVFGVCGFEAPMGNDLGERTFLEKSHSDARESYTGVCWQVTDLNRNGNRGLCFHSTQCDGNTWLRIEGSHIHA